MSADSLWISAEKRQNSETALLSVQYLSDFNPGKFRLKINPEHSNKQILWQILLLHVVGLLVFYVKSRFISGKRHK